MCVYVCVYVYVRVCHVCMYMPRHVVFLGKILLGPSESPILESTFLKGPEGGLKHLDFSHQEFKSEDDLGL